MKPAEFVAELNPGDVLAMEVAEGEHAHKWVILCKSNDGEYILGDAAGEVVFYPSAETAVAAYRTLGPVTRLFGRVGYK